MSTVIKRRLQGLLFVVVLLALSGIAVGEYTGVFDEGVPVTLRVERVGNQLTERADVKVRGLNVGRGRAEHRPGQGRPDPGQRLGAVDPQDALR
jgi:hypothetical protein